MKKILDQIVYLNFQYENILIIKDVGFWTNNFKFSVMRSYAICGDLIAINYKNH